MKKNIIGIGLISIIVILIIGILYLNIFSKSYNTKKQKETTFASSYNLEGKNIITSSISSAQIEKFYSDDFATLVNHSDAVVKGKVVSVNYEAIQGNAWTRIKFHINDVINGNIKVNEDINIYYIGGYITLEDHIKYNDDAFRYENMSDEEIKNTVIKETYDGETEFIKENEELVLCIVKTSDCSPLPKGSYERLYSSGMLKLKGNKYVQLYGEVKERYSIDKDKLHDIKKLIE